MKRLALFDFDGTISTKDSFLWFLRYTHSFPQVAYNVLSVLPDLAGYKLGFISNETAKQKLFSAFYRGVPVSVFEQWSVSYLSEINSFVKPKALECIRKHQQQGDRVVVVSAGFDLILTHWCRQEQVELLATCIGVANGVITGTFDGRNCYGREKVERIKSYLNLSDYDDVYAYGDSPGDLEMMKISNRPHHHKRIFH